MFNGSNEVYSPVSAYSVMPFGDGGIISGGSGDHNIVVQGTRFFGSMTLIVPKLAGLLGEANGIVE